MGSCCRRKGWPEVRILTKSFQKACTQLQRDSEAMMEENAYLQVDEEMVNKVRETMPPEEEMQDLAEFYRVFGDATRLKILYVLLCSEMCVYDIANLIGMSQSAVSHQLRILKQMDLVKNRREGKTIFYALADAHIVTILSQGLDHIEE